MQDNLDLETVPDIDAARRMLDVDRDESMKSEQH
jgi:hypothetical protein